MRIAILLALAVVCVSLVGCTTYHRVVDPGGGGVYYTTDLDKHSSGSITFTDAVTGDEVTITSSQVREIDSEEYQQEVALAKAKRSENQ